MLALIKAIYLGVGLTGRTGSLVLKNLFDISGNVYDWVMETASVSARYARRRKRSAEVGVNSRTSVSPTTAHINMGFRVCLYIK